LEEIEAATKNFDTSSFIGECSNGQVDAQLNKRVTPYNIISHVDTLDTIPGNVIPI
jgi:hypothetical protein